MTKAEWTKIPNRTCGHAVSLSSDLPRAIYQVLSSLSSVSESESDTFFIIDSTSSYSDRVSQQRDFASSLFQKKKKIVYKINKTRHDQVQNYIKDSTSAAILSYSVTPKISLMISELSTVQNSGSWAKFKMSISIQSEQAILNLTVN